jgi:hypothetical protein
MKFTPLLDVLPTAFKISRDGLTYDVFTMNGTRLPVKTGGYDLRYGDGAIGSLGTDLDGGFIDIDPDSGKETLLDERGHPRFAIGSPAGQLQVSWSSLWAAPVVTACAGAAGERWVGSLDGRLAAVRLDGTVLWQAQVPPGASSLNTGPWVVACAGDVIVAETYPVVAGYDASDGSMLWAATLHLNGLTDWLTDGRTVVFYTGSEYWWDANDNWLGPGWFVSFAGIDLATGRAWTAAKEPPGSAWLYFVDGQVVEISRTWQAYTSSSRTTIASGPHAGEEILPIPSTLARLVLLPLSPTG